MAPIQNKSSSSSSYSYNKSSSSHESTPRRDRDASSSFLPITRRGRFFQDSFFENTRSHFDEAVRDALHRWGDDSDFLTDTWHDERTPRMSNLSRYRQMRSQSIDEDNLAVTVTSDNHMHKIVLDVHDFKDGDLKVKVVGDRELLVEGSQEKKSEGASAISANKFSRRFALPQEVDVAAIDSVMSSDGILTITAPKKGRIGGNTCYSCSSTKCHDAAREPCDCDKCYPKLRTRENRCSSHTEKSQSPADNAHRTKREGTRERSDVRSHSSSVETNSNKSHNVPINAFFNSRPIARKGRFFDDAFFEDTRSGYRTAIQDILSKWGEKSSNTDDLTSYRNLRTRDLREDNQAVKSMEDEFQHKFIIDVHDFMKDGEINVKAVDDRELVVEGHVTKQEGNSKSINRFSRRFLLPSDVHLESVSSVMSSDGVLTIIAPKKNAIQNMAENNESSHDNTINNSIETFSKITESCMQTSSGADNPEKSYIDASSCGLEAEIGDRNLRESSTASSVLDNSNVQEEAILHDSVTSKVYKAEEAQKANVCGGHNISIFVDADEEQYTDATNIDETNMESTEADGNNTGGGSMDDLTRNLRSVRGKSAENLDVAQRSVRGKSAEDMETDQRSVRGSSMDDFDSALRRIRGRSTEPGWVRFDREFDMDDEDNINFEGSSTHTDVAGKKLRSILKKPDRIYQDDDERNSRERSCTREDSSDLDRTPNRDCKRASGYAPLNPDAKRALPISIRGHFSSDPYFNDFQDNFKTAIKDVLLKFNERSSNGDDITAYRNLRLRDPKLENQAFHVQEDQGAHKVVLDVKDFVNGQIEAAVYGDSELVVEGKAERRAGSSITILSFLRRFPLPENVDADAITIVMSSDGVLTVVTPWKGRSGLSAIKNILSQDRSIFDRHGSDLDRHWDDTDWSSSRRDSDDFMTHSLSRRFRSRINRDEDDLF